MVIKPPLVERIVIPGPAGDLQAIVETPAALAASGASPRYFAVVCHPHPLFGGTLENKVVYTLARAFEDLGAVAIRFNFRGVGSSSGQYDEGIGETQDALAAVAYGRQRWPDAALWLGGFSFGGAVAIRAAQPGGAQQLVAVSPAVTRIDVHGAVTPSYPWLIVQGDADDVVECNSVLEWSARQAPRPTVNVMAGAGHFFHGRLNDLREVVLAFLRERL